MNITSCDLITITKEALNEQHQAPPERIFLFDQPLDAAIPVAAAPRDVRQVIEDYLTKAVEYSTKHSPLVITIQRKQSLAYLAVNIVGKELPLVHRYSAPEHISPTSSKGVSTSTSLGLYSCRKLIEQYNGQIGLRQRPGEGLTFWLTLPLQENPI